MILVSTTNINFGNILVGDDSSQNVTIFNDNNINVNVTLSSTNPVFTTVTTEVVPANGSVDVSITFTPTNEVTQSGNITIVNDDPGDPNDDVISLMGTGIKPVIEVEPTNLDFSFVAIQDTKDLNLTIRNTDNDATLKVTNIVSDNVDYTPSTTVFNVSPGQEKVIAISFLPIADGTSSGTLTITNNSSNDDSFDIALTGIGEIPHIDVNPSSINYGGITLNDSKVENVIVSNNSIHDGVRLRLSDVSIDNSNFSETISTFILNTGEALNVPVTFIPPDTSLQTGTLTIQSNDITTGDATVDLSGQGIVASNISVLTSELNFGAIGLNVTSDKSLRVFNNGVIGLNISSISTDNVSFVVTPSAQVIPPGDFYDFVVSFTPTILGDSLGKVLINSNDPDTPLLDTVNLKGIGETPEITFLDSELDFGIVPVNEETTDTFKIKNSGDVDLLISNITSNNSVFEVVSFPTIISKNSTEDVTVKFLPVSIGSQTGMLTIASNDYNNPTTEYNVLGNGVIADISINPTSLNFGIIVVGTSKTMDITISNVGLATLEISDVISSDIDIFITDKTTFSVAPSTSTVLKVTYMPDSNVASSETITLINNDPSEPNLVIDVVGVGGEATLNIDTSGINFGTVAINDKKDVSYAVGNSGNAELQVTVSTTPVEYTVVPNSLTVPAGSTENITVSFSPTLTGTLGGILKFVDALANETTVSLSGIGANLPSASTSVTSIDFGETSQGSQKVRSFSIYNNGTANLTYTIAVDVNPVFSAVPNSGTITAGNSELISAIFEPDAISSFSGNYLITTNDPNNSLLTISATGTGLPGALSWTTFNTKDIIPDAIKDIAEAINDMLDPLLTALDFISGILDIIKEFIISVPDPMTVLLEAIKALLNQVKENLLGTNIFFLTIIPGDKRINPDLTPNYFQGLIEEQVDKVFKEDDYLNSIKGGSQVFINKIASSFDDSADDKRPQFDSDSYCGGIVIAADSGDLGYILEVTEKLLNIFKLEYKSQFTPPTNVTAVASSDDVRLTFAGGNGLLPNSFLIFRSEFLGGEEVTETATIGGELEPKKDKYGRPVTSYDLVGITDLNEQLAEMLNVDGITANNIVQQAAGYMSGVLANANQLFSSKFIYEDENVEVNKSYYYVIASAMIDLDKKTEILSKNYTSAQIQLKVVKDTGILTMGPFSTEVNATAINSFELDENGLSRCRYYRCTVEESYSQREFLKGNSIKLDFEPIRSTLQIDVRKEVETQNIQTGRTQISYEVNTLSTKQYSVVKDTVNFINSNLFTDKDEFVFTYKYQKDFGKTEIKNEKHSNLSNGDTITLKNVPINSVSVKIIANDTKILVQGTDFTVIDILRGRITINSQQLLGTFFVNVDYEYFKTFTDKETFECINPEFNKYYFDYVKCNNGTTLCPGYENANCFYNNGISCTINNETVVGNVNEEVQQTQNGETFFLNNGNIDYNSLVIYVSEISRTIEKDIDFFLEDYVTGKIKLESNQLYYDRDYTLYIDYRFGPARRSQRKVITYEDDKYVLKEENVAFNEFYDAVACQNGTMAQRCDGYTKVAPRPGFKGTPPDWYSVGVGDLFPIIIETIELMEKIVDALLSGTVKLSDALLNFIDLIQKKIDNLRSFIEQIQEVLDTIEDEFDIPNLFLLNIPLAKGGNDYLKTSILNASDGPDSDLTGYTMGVAMVYGAQDIDDSAIIAIQKSFDFLF